MKFTVYCVIITAFVASALSAPDIKRRIIGGKQIDIKDACFTVYVTVEWEFSCNVLCGGAIINENWALTAGHCVTKPFLGGLSCVLPADLSALTGLFSFLSHVVAPDAIKIRSDSNTPASGGGKLHSASDVKRHPSFNVQKIDYDLAVVRVMEPFSTSCVIALPAAGSTYLDYTEIRIFGWGVTSNGSLSTYLQVATVYKVNQQNCQSAYGAGVITDQMFCANATNKDSCQGDSGGPATTVNTNGTLVLIGSVSFGNGCANPKYPGVYAAIFNTANRNFIKNVTDV